MKNCPSCRAPMIARRQDYIYDASGLKNVTLKDITRHECPACNETETSFPAIEKLHIELAMDITAKSGRKEDLSFDEYVFARKYYDADYDPKKDPLAEWREGPASTPRTLRHGPKGWKFE